jgi:hypothetical protein
MLYNQFLGQSRAYSGATRLDINPIVKIREGYLIDTGSGTTTEYVNAGEYRIISMSNYGYDAQKINLNAKNEFGMMGYDRRVFPNKYKNGFYYYTDFSDDNSIKDWSFTDTGYWGVTAGSLQRGKSFPAPFSHALLNTNMGLEDFTIRTLFKTTAGFDVGYGAVGVAMKMQDNVQTSVKFPNTEAIWHIKEIAYERCAHHVYRNGGYYTSQSGQSLPLADNTWYDFKVYAKNGSVRAYYRENVATGWIECLDKGGVNLYNAGGVGLVSYAGYSGVADFARFEVQELGGVYTRKDILDDFARQRDDTVCIEDEFSGFSTFFGLDGSTFILGETNGYQQLDFRVPGAGDTCMVALTTGFTFNDFVLDFEFCGPTGSFGVAFGTTASWAGFYRTSQSGGGGMMMGIYGASREWYLQPIGAPHINIWRKGRLAKTGTLYKFYLDNEFVGLYSNASLGSNGNSIGIGVHVYRAGITAIPYSFRNFKISSMDDIIDDTEFGAMGNIANDFNRLLPRGYMARYFGETIIISKISGATDANLGHLTNSRMTENIDQINKYMYIKGNDVGAVLTNTDFRARVSGDYSSFDVINDTTIQDKGTIDVLAQEALKNMRSMDNSYEVNIMPNLLLDKYDGINLVDPTIGVSTLTSIDSLTKDIEMETGYFGENLILQDKQDGD